MEAEFDIISSENTVDGGLYISNIQLEVNEIIQRKFASISSLTADEIQHFIQFVGRAAFLLQEQLFTVFVDYLLHESTHFAPKDIIPVAVRLIYDHHLQIENHISKFHKFIAIVFAEYVLCSQYEQYYAYLKSCAQLNTITCEKTEAVFGMNWFEQEKVENKFVSNIHAIFRTHIDDSIFFNRLKSRYISLYRFPQQLLVDHLHLIYNDKNTPRQVCDTVCGLMVLGLTLNDEEMGIFMQNFSKLTFTEKFSIVEIDKVSCLIGREHIINLIKESDFRSLCKNVHLFNYAPRDYISAVLSLFEPQSVTCRDIYRMCRACNAFFASNNDETVIETFFDLPIQKLAQRIVWSLSKFVEEGAYDYSIVSNHVNSLICLNSIRSTESSLFSIFEIVKVLKTIQKTFFGLSIFESQMTQLVQEWDGGTCISSILQECILIDTELLAFFACDQPEDVEVYSSAEVGILFNALYHDCNVMVCFTGGFPKIETFFANLSGRELSADEKEEAILMIDLLMNADFEHLIPCEEDQFVYPSFILDHIEKKYASQVFNIVCQSIEN
ncbi:hypothetical protein PCE1_002416 [Barthelona sp. PCE]